MHFLRRQLSKALLTPIKALRKRYIPLLLIYFAYGASGFSSIALTFWEKENLSLSAEQLITIGVWAFLPWTLKMVFGQLVDSVPILGSRRKVYVFIGAGFMVLGTLFLTGLAGDYAWAKSWGSEYTLYLLSAVCSTIGFVIQDVTADTMTTEVVPRTKTVKGKTVQRSEAEIQGDLSMVQVLGRLSLSMAAFLVAGLGGYLAKHIPYLTIFWLTLIIPIISCVGALLVKLDTEDENPPKLDPTILGGGLAFTAFSIFMAFQDSAYSQEIVFGVSLIILCAMTHLVTRALAPNKRKVLLCTLVALFLYRATPGIGPGFSWFSMDILGFDQLFFGVLAQTGSAIALIVLWLFSDFISTRPIRSVLLLLVFVETVLATPELLLYYDVHTTLGISAQSVALVDTALGSPLVHISMVPMLALIAFYAPAKYRGTWFAIGASLMNLALTAGALGTKYLNKIFVVTREVMDEAGAVITQANYDDLGWLMVVRLGISFILPLIAILVFLRKTPKGASVHALEEVVAEDLPEEGPIPPRKRIEP